MKNLLKKIFLIFAMLLPTVLWYVNSSNVGIAPEFEKDFINYLKDSDSEARVFVLQWVSYKNTLWHNLRCIFYPNNGLSIEWCSSANYWWSLRNVMKYLWYALLVLLMKYLLPLVTINFNSTSNIGRDLFKTNLNIGQKDP